MKEKLLELLKNTDGYLSGEEIGSILGVSRAAVWKNINALRKDGFVIEAVTNKGYKLSEEADIISSSFIEKNIKTKYLAKKVIFMPTVDSTNEECKRLAADGEKEGTLVVADEQTGGKGRRGRHWNSEKGSGIWMSIILRPEISPWNVSSITLVAGLAVSKAVKIATIRDFSSATPVAVIFLYSINLSTSDTMQNKKLTKETIFFFSENFSFKTL